MNKQGYQNKQGENTESSPKEHEHSRHQPDDTQRDTHAVAGGRSQNVESIEDMEEDLDDQQKEQREQKD